MSAELPPLPPPERRPGPLWLGARFFLRVLRTFFFENKGLLLSGAVAYNTLLSLIPLLVVALVILSHVWAEDELLAIVGTELSLIAPAQAETLKEAVATFLGERDVVGWIGAGVLLFLSSIAFRILEDAIATIFKTPDRHLKPNKREFWVSALIPYAFIAVFTVALFLITGLISLVSSLEERPLTLFGRSYALSGVVLDLLGWIGLVALFTSIYKVLPTVHVSTRRALAGGLTAALLWEIVRRILTYYFTNISLVGVVYGSLATVIVVLVTLEVGAVILLLGAEVIAELESNAKRGLAWHGQWAQPGGAPAAAEPPQGEGGEAADLAEGEANPESEVGPAGEEAAPAD